MDKEKWNKIKNDTISYETLKEYFQEQGGKDIPLHEFVKVAQHLEGKMVHNSQGQMVIIDMEKSKEKVREYYNERYKD